MNLVHGVACYRCTNSSVGCSFVAKQPNAGPHWTYDQRRWILVQWARTATKKSPHPSETVGKFKADFAPPGWFLDGLQTARDCAQDRDDDDGPKKRARRTRTESPTGVKRRATASTSDPEEDSPAPRAVSTPAKRKRRSRGKRVAVKRTEEEEEEGDILEGEESESDQDGEQDERADMRPTKRPGANSRAVPRADAWAHSRASSAVPQTQSEYSPFFLQQTYLLISRDVATFAQRRSHAGWASARLGARAFGRGAGRRVGGQC